MVIFKNKRIQKIGLFLVLGFVLITCVGFSYSYYEARAICVKEYTFSKDNIPQSFDGKKIIFISDIHFDKYFGQQELSSLVGRINERKPDIIVLGGDYSKKGDEYLPFFFSEISKLQSKYGVYFVLGNHDHWEDKELIQNGLINCGFLPCDNQSYWLKIGNDSIKIGGVGDFWEDEQLISNTTSDVNSDDFCILLSHNPDYIEVVDDDKIDLMLSGHTHGGQVTIFGLWAPIMPSTMHPEYLQTGQKYRYGWKEKHNISIYITSGIGMGSFPFRFFAKPEIVEITLKRG